MSKLAPAPLLSVRDLKTHFSVGGSWRRSAARVIRAVDGVSFDVAAGETLGIVGESGCGKTTLGRTLLRLVEPTAGTIHFGGTDFLALRGEALRRARRHLQIVFQDPFSSLNPRLRVGTTIKEGLTVHGLAEGAAADVRVRQLLEEVGLRADDARRYPHEFSGGQRQRIGIARALAVEPKLIVLDEPVSALDVSVQAQIVNLLTEIQRQRALAYIFIAHDLSVVENVADHIGVMYLGRFVEFGRSQAVFQNPQMPYTHALLSAVPIPDPLVRQQRVVLGGEPPSAIEPPSGCPFHPRCPLAAKDAECERTVPTLANTGATGEPHLVACIKRAPTVV